VLDALRTCRKFSVICCLLDHFIFTFGVLTCDMSTGCPKNWHNQSINQRDAERRLRWASMDTILYDLTLSNINRFSKSFHCQNQERICNYNFTNDPTTPQVCRCTTLWNVSVWSVASQAWVHRLAAIRTHLIFDVKTAGCQSYFRQ